MLSNKRPLLFAAAFALVMPTFSAQADDEPEHFEGEPSRTLEEALNNLSVYNKKLEKLLDSGMTPEKMGEVHQLTYTLENALKRIEDEVDDLAETLEEVHLASERAEDDTVMEKGKIYLDGSGKLIRE
ncbi:DUF6746 family protein [Thiohalophilus thiocyanatoxydans]|uniref:Soluble cytochrome b562 n=1 Tax=Thiohalophilus thiocyanatoxydans TaxID=381308 RepID=A0A4R8IYU8_9GAMM|nr:DUF6746 family protein [Thiohalophilus thiocyanatoxydans]TDY02623.1 hypothetical protein EDC23_0998 [Thiohalophilus thiocyanatoxydans]